MDSWKIKNYAVSSLAKYGIQFGHSKSFVCTCSGERIHVYSSEGGRLLNQFGRQNDSKFIQIEKHPKMGFQLYSLSDDGVICLWNYIDGTLLKEFTFEISPIHFALNPVNSSQLIVVGKNANYEIWMYDILSKELTSIAHLSEFKGIAVTESVSLVVVYEPRKCTIIDLDSPNLQQAVLKHDSAEITAVSVSPINSCFAVGDSKGVITLCYCRDTETNSLKNEPVASTVHWHAHAVSSLLFTNTGNYILSGGQEGVLLMWHVQKLSRTFLPRLGASISKISLSNDDLYCAISLQNGSIRIVEMSAFKLVSRIETLYSPPNRKLTPTNSILVREPKDNMLVVAGDRGMLQFWHSDSLYVKASVSVSPHNTKLSGLVSKAAQEPLPLHVGFSRNGTWMITLDVRHNHRFSTEVFLKFWRWDDVQSTYILHTRVDYPHGRSKVTSINVSQDKDDVPLVVSTGRDNSFKLWALKEDIWQCDSVGSFRGMPGESAQFSWDHSLLAVAFGNCITLWQSETSRLVQTLCTGSERYATVKKVCFLPGTSYLVSTILYSRTANTEAHYEVVVWDLLSCNCIWSTSSDMRPIVCVSPTNSSESQFLLFTHDKIERGATVHLVQTSNSCAPVTKFQQQLPYNVVHAICDSLSPPSFWIYTEDYQLINYCPESRLNLESPKSDSAFTESSKGLFSSLFGSIESAGSPEKDEPIAQVPMEIASQISRNKLKELQFIKETSSHVVPPLESWCFQYWNAIISKQ